MKTINLQNKTMTAALVAALAITGFSSCKKKGCTDSTATNYNAKAKKDDGSCTYATNTAVSTTEISGEITTDQHWTADQHYLLKGYVYVTSGTTLTIDAGTVIKGDKGTKGALIIEQGGKIIAAGTSTNPIIFTSNLPVGQRSYGDWGGVIICGNAPTNWVAASYQDGTSGTLPAGVGQVEGGPRSLYGGTDPNDNSGTMQYCRIEFGGVAFSPNNEINGLSLCAVGAGTTMDHIQVSYSGDDSYEFFGGTVNTKYMICHKGWDDDFDTDNGFSGSIQFGMVYRDPYAADQSGSHTFESDSRDENATATPITKAVFSNITAVGPLTNPNFNGYNPNFVCGQVVRRSSSLSVFNSVIAGYPLGVLVDEDPTYGSTVANIYSGDLKFQNNAVVGMPDQMAAVIARQNDPHSAPNSVSYTTQDSSAWTGSPSGPMQWFNNGNNYWGATEGLTTRLTNPFNGTNPNFKPTSTSYIVYTSSSAPTTAKFPPSFTDSKLSSFNAVDYIGAFSATDTWTNGWTNFDPQNADYGDAY